MSLHQVMIVKENELLCLLVIKRVELREIVPKDLNPIFEGKAGGEVESLALARHGLCFLVLVIYVLIGAEGLIAILFYHLDILLNLASLLFRFQSLIFVFRNISMTALLARQFILLL